MSKLMKTISVITMLIFLRTGFALAAEQVFFYYTDPAGTPLAMTDTSGTVVWRADYLPFGEEMVDTSTVQNNKMFVGKERDSENGLYYFGARYMDSTAGRFISPDPVGAVDPQSGELNPFILHDPQRLNYYSYALNNPYRYIDKDGRFTGVEEAYGLYVLTTVTIAVLTGRAAAILHHEQQKGDAGTSQSRPNDSNSEGNKEISDKTDMSKPSTWPQPPTENLPVRESEPSRKKPRDRGEKSLIDSKGGEWRPHKPDEHHPEGHWDYKEHPKGPWVNIPQ